MGSGNHPVEVVGRIRGHPDGRDHQSALTVLSSGSSVRVKTDQGYRDFVLDGVSVSEQESLRAFYSKYVEARVDDVRAGGRCTVMMYGPTGSGKSHTMFGSVKEPGVAYLALHQIMSRAPQGIQVSANVLEIYNEDIYDLLTSTSNPISSPGPRYLKSVPGRAKLEVRGRKVRNATCISGDDPAKLVQEISKVEKRRVVKSTNSNDRSSRSHCMVVLDILGVGGRLVLVDMAGSENSDQAGSGMEAKIQTGKINQGNSALKRVVECIANGDPYIPYRDSKLTMLLQDSFEDDRAKILMILCASPDPRDGHKTICTLEYGAKAKCIVRLPSSPPKEAGTPADGTEVLQARLRFKDECLERLRVDYEQKEKAHDAEVEKLAKREQELVELRLKIEKVEAERVQKLVEFQKQMDQMMEEKSKELRKALELEMRMNVHKAIPDVDEARLRELERVIEDQGKEIAVLRLRAEKAEAQLAQLQESSKETAESCERAEGLLACDMKHLSNISAVESLNSWACYSSPRSPGPAVTRNTRSEDLFETDASPRRDKLVDMDFNFSGSLNSAQEVGCTKHQFELSAAGDPPSSPEAASTQKAENIALLPETTPTGKAWTQSTCFSPDAVAARRARIENIFLLCGNGREVAAKCKVPNSRDEDYAPGVPFRPLDNQFLRTNPALSKPKSLARYRENMAPLSPVS